MGVGHLWRGRPVTETEEIKIKIGELILDFERIEYIKIKRCEIEWIIAEPNRKWINIFYTCSTRPEICSTSAKYYDWEGHVKYCGQD